MMTNPIVTVEDLRAEALTLLNAVADGDGLDPPVAALVRLAVHASVATLDGDGIDWTMRRALEAGATAAQVHETLVLVSGLGMHTLMEGSRRLASVLRENGDTSLDGPLDDTRIALRDRLEGNGGGYWRRFDRETPGFLDALLRLSPEAYEAFFTYCAVPWRMDALGALEKELLSLASDATPGHRYLPGLRVHVVNAIRLGAGRKAVLQALDIAATAPPHPGVPGHRTPA